MNRTGQEKGARRRLRRACTVAIVLTMCGTAACATASPDGESKGPAPQRSEGGRIAALGGRGGMDVSPRSPGPGFVLSRGRYTTVEAPGATVETGVCSNNRGVLAGVARNEVRDVGFVRDTRGRFSTVRYPGAKGTSVVKLNDRGHLIGNFSTEFTDPRVRPTAYLKDGSRFTKIAVPGAMATSAGGINNRGQVVGQFRDEDGLFHGFLWQKGQFTILDVPGAAETSAQDINDRGQIVGDVVGADGKFRGFMFERGRYTTFDLPGDSPIGSPVDINNRGDIVAFTVDDLTDITTIRSFVLTKGIRGKAAPINFPGTPVTLAVCITDRGVITGVYGNPRAAEGADSQAPGTMEKMPGMAMLPTP